MGDDILNFVSIWFLSVLQRFYHQQSQLRERETNGYQQQYYNQIPHHQQMQYHADHENFQHDGRHMKDESHTNPFMKHIPKLTQKLNPFKQQSNSPKTTNGSRKEAIYANTNMITNQKPYDELCDMMPPRENVHRQRLPAIPPDDIYNKYPNYIDHYPAEYKNAYNMSESHGTPIKSKKSNGHGSNRDDSGERTVFFYSNWLCAVCASIALHCKRQNLASLMT